MPSQYRHRRTSNPATAFPLTIEPGEIAVNTANRQLVVGDANAATIGNPLGLLAMRFFDTRAQYAIGDFVVEAAKIYRAKAVIAPGVFNPTQWDIIDPTAFVTKSGDTMTGQLSLPTTPAPVAANAVRKDYVDAADTAITLLVTGLDTDKVDVTGDTMSGPLLLPLAAPTLDEQAANKKYVDDAIGSAAPASPLYISENPPMSPAPNSLWWDSGAGMLFVLYNDGTSTAWVLASPVAVPVDTSAFVAKTGDTMSGHLVLPASPAATNAVRKDYVDAAIAAIPSAAASPSAADGIQVNGAFLVNQALGVTTTGTSLSYVADMWKLYKGGTAVIAAGASYGAQFVPNFNNYLYVSVSTASVSLAAGDYYTVAQLIEGWRMARLHWGTAQARPITINFWSNHNRTGIYSVIIRNPTGGSEQSYAATYNHVVSDVAQYNTINVPGPTTGTWAAEISLGMILDFGFACGATYTAPSNNAWLAGTYSAALGQVNAVAAVTDVFRITGLTVFPGPVTITAAQAPLLVRPYGQELAICQRYFEFVPYDIMIYSHVAGEVSENSVRFAVEKRVVPTLGGFGPDPYRSQAVLYNSQNMAQRPTLYGCTNYFVSAGTGATYVVGYRSYADARY